MVLKEYYLVGRWTFDESPGQLLSSLLEAHSSGKWFLHIRTIAIFSMKGIGIAIVIAKVVVQPILEPIGNRNRIRVINLMCEWTLRSLYWRPICLAYTAAI